MQQVAVQALLSLLPAAPGGFSGSQFPLPVKTAILGDKSLDMALLQDEIKRKSSGDIKHLLSPLLLAAEAYESVQEDRDRYFINDRKVQNYVFTGSKWRAGWALVLGGTNNRDLVDGLKEREFMVFTDQPDLSDTWYIGPRPTAPVYFLQLMVRYGLIWGCIRPGDNHQMGHYLEADMPGLLILREGLDPLKYVLALGLMKLGAPALVPSSFPFPYGNRVVADTVPDIFSRLNGFQNLRQKHYKGEIISLPDYANPAFAGQEFTAARTLGGTEKSFFCVRPAGSPIPEPVSTSTDKGNIGIVIDIDEPHFTDDIAWGVEKAALRALNFLDGVRASLTDNGFLLEFAEGASFDETRVRGVLHDGIRLQYPGIRRISIQLVQDDLSLESAGCETKAYKERRKSFMDAMTEENTEEFCVCTECRPFSLVHTCILTPDRMPMCGARTYFTVKAGHYFGSDVTPYQRRAENDLPLRFAFRKGKILDPMKGEYEGANKIYHDMTQGKLSRVYLHSLKDVPHTSCGCFQNLAFFLEGMEGAIGIMKRASSATAPDGRNWEMLANYAGGKQSPGIMGVSFQYLMSDSFLRGDGGMGKVVWVDSELYPKIKSRFRSDQRVATEKEAPTIEALKRFLRG
jgi:hypothetical protein